jgi:hypothetical protein
VNLLFHDHSGNLRGGASTRQGSGADIFPEMWVKPDMAKDPHQPNLRRRLERLIEIFDLESKRIAGVFNVSDQHFSDMKAGRRRIQGHHIAKFVREMRKLDKRKGDLYKPGSESVQAWQTWFELSLFESFIVDEFEYEQTDRTINDREIADLKLDLLRAIPGEADINGIDFSEDDVRFYAREEFSLGGHKKESIVIEFIAEGYERSLIQCSFEYGDLKVSSDEGQKRAYNVAMQEAIQKKENGEIFNGQGYALTYLKASRTDGDETPHLIMRFKKSDYFRKFACRAMFSSNIMEKHRKDVLSKVFSEVVEEFSGGFGAVISIITADNKLLFFQRSLHTAGDQNAYDCTVTEASDASDIDYYGQPSPIKTAIRALSQEAAISGIEDDIQHLIRFHSINCRSKYYDWSIMGSLDLRGTVETTDNLRRRADSTRLSRKRPAYSSEDIGTTFLLAKDSFEFQRYASVDFNVRDVIRFIVTHKMADYAFVNAVLTLKSRLNASATMIANELRMYPPDMA